MKTKLNFIEFINVNTTDTAKYRMIKEYEELNSKGFIGDCSLRTLARDWIAYLGVNIGITGVMQDIAMECYKCFAYRYIVLKDL